MQDEYSLRSELDPAYVVRPLELIQAGGHPMLVLEDPGGTPLDLLLDGPMEIARLLRLAIGIAAALGHVHSRGIVHRDVKPANILVNTARDNTWLTGLGIASRLPRERQSAQPPEFLAGTLAYMAPEQTGRMNRSIDFRSDLYSLGVTLYQMLTGSLPFTASDPMEWVHCHIARTPVPPAERSERVPAALSRIIMKLLAKMAEERYQSAAGVESDLRRCLTEWETQHRIDDFPLGEHDTPDRLLIPEKLYGRESEVAALLSAFDRVVTGDKPELVLVSGYSGIGKSSVVNELHKSLVPPRALFASGKFDQYKRDIPYSTLVQAFQGLVRSLLTKSDAELNSWRDALVEALCPNARLMVDFVPELKLIIGEQAPVPDLPPQQAQGRFQLVFRRFISVFARSQHPLVLFLDDLQWVDSATLDLLEELLTRSDLRYVLLIGAYRDNEVDAAHPLAHTLQALRNVGARIEEITVPPLARADIGQLIADALRCKPRGAAPLAQLVHGKTGGNPFFAIQFISSLAEEGLLLFDQDAGSWSWDLERIHAKGYTDNVVTLITGKLTRLHSETREAMQQLACVGNTAQISMLSIAFGTSAEQVRTDLSEAVRLELVEERKGAYTFIHDRVQEAAYSLLPEAARASAHVRIGRLLAAQTPPQEREETIFEIVNQLNRGAVLITELGERVRVAELNLIAGRRAKAATAYTSACGYLRNGTDMLGGDGWANQYPLAFALRLECAECEYLSGDFEEAERLISELLPRAASKIDKAALYRLKVDLYAVKSESPKAVESALECLRLFGIEMPPHPTRARVETEYEKVWSNLGGRSIESLIDLPLMTDPEIEAAMRVLSVLFAPALSTDVNLAYLLVCQMVNLTLRYGTTGASTQAYAFFGVILRPAFHRYGDDYRFGRLACDLVEKHNLLADKAKTYLAMEMIAVWAQPLQAGLDYAQKAVRCGVETGDLTIACYGCSHTVTALLLRGDHLDQVWQESERGLEFARNAKFRDAIDSIMIQQRFIENMRGRTAHFSTFSDATFDERAYEAQLMEDRTATMVSRYWMYWIRKLQARFLSGDYETALDAARKAKALLWVTDTHVRSLDYYYYTALAIAAAYETLPDGGQREWREVLDAHLRQLREWAENCSPTFRDKHALVAAETARLDHRELDAERLYEEAIRSARENGFVQNEALVCELAARFYAARGFDEFARLYLRHAHAAYLRWGAVGKVRQLEALHPHLGEQEQAPTSTSTIGAPVEHLDLATVIKVSEVLSGEMVLEKLIFKLMRTAIQHAGAARGLLIVPRGSELQVEAEATTGGDDVTVRLRDGAETEAALPESVVRSVMRTRESVILDDASVHNSFSSDPYIVRHRARSVLCLPVSSRGKLIGLLYLENNLLPHVFVPARVAALKVLAAQAAMSLENARLYSDLAKREAKIRRLVDANVVGIIIWDLNGAILEANDAFLRMVGYEREDLVSGRLRWTELTPAQWRGRDRQEFVAEIQRTGSLQPFEWEYLRKDGNRVPVLVGAASFEGENQGVGFVLDLTERKRAEEGLRKSEAKFRDYAESASDWLWEVGPDYKFTFLTENAFGSNAADRIGTACWDHALDLETEPEKWRVVRATLESRKPFRDFVFSAMGGNGSPMYVKAAGRPVFDTNREFRGYRGTCTDVTTAIRAQEERERLYRDLAKREAKIRRLVDANVVGILIWDLDGTVLEANEALLRMVGYEREDLVSGRLRWTDLTPAQWRGRNRRELVEELQRTGSLQPFEWEYLRKDGSRVPVLVGAASFEGENQGVAFVLDLTERKRVDEALRQSEVYLAEAQRLAHTGSWAYDHVLGKVTHYSDEAFRVFGLDPRRPSGPPQLEETRQLIHPGDRERVFEELAQMFRDKAEYDQQYRIVLPDGTVRHLHSIGHPVLNKAGELVEYFGTVINVTERVHAEHRLHVQHRVARILAEATTVDEAMPRILEMMGDWPGWDLGALWQNDRHAGVLRCAELWRTPSLEAAQFEAITRTSTFSPGIGLPGRVWASGLPAYIPDVTRDPNFPRAHIAAREGLHGAFAFPILLGREVLGVIEFFSRDVWQRDDDLLVMMATIGSQIGQFTKRAAAVNELRLRVNMLQQIPVAAWSVTPDGNPDIVGQGWFDYTGQTPEYVNSHPEAWMACIHPEDRESASRAYWEGIRSGRGFTMEARFLRASDGTYRWHLNRAVAVRDPEGNILRFVGTSTDVHDLRQTQEELRSTQAEFGRMTRVMTMGELTASIAHEVNQPLGAIVTSAASCKRWLAAKPPQMDKARRALERIVNDGRRAGAIIQRIRTLMTRQTPRKDWLDVNETVLEVIALTQYELRQNDIVLETRLSEGLPRVPGDKVQCQQVLLNLIINSIEAMSEIGQRRRELTIVSATDGPDAVRVEVRDSGTGLDPERAAQLFKPFYTTKAEGLGIGLSISRSIVEAHGGRLTAGANAPHGAVFRISLPVQEQMP